MTHGVHLQSSSQAGHHSRVCLELRCLSCKRSTNTVKAFLRERTMLSGSWPNSTQSAPLISHLKNFDLIALFRVNIFLLAGEKFSILKNRNWIFFNNWFPVWTGNQSARRNSSLGLVACCGWRVFPSPRCEWKRGLWTQGDEKATVYCHERNNGF